MPFGPVRAFGPIPPTASRRAPPVHEDTGVYAARRAQGVPMLFVLEFSLQSRFSLLPPCRPLPFPRSGIYGAVEALIDDLDLNFLGFERVEEAMGAPEG